jgi:hypothetical protein
MDDKDLFDMLKIFVFVIGTLAVALLLTSGFVYLLVHILK